MEIVKKGCEQQLTALLNTIDTTCNIKFTYEEGVKTCPCHIDGTERGLDDQTPRVSEEDTHRPVSEL